MPLRIGQDRRGTVELRNSHFIIQPQEVISDKLASLMEWRDKEFCRL